jgi:CRP/FNR family transcriptional regulator, cyclic AMP receptor protein
MRKVLFIFSVLTDGDVEWLATAGERMHLDRGTTLIPLGAHVHDVFFLLDGRLTVRTRAGETIATLESGEVIGEMSLVDPAPTTVSVEVATDSTVLRLSHDVVREKLAGDPGFASRFYRALCVFLADRMRHATRRMGYGSAARSQDDAGEQELNDDLLDNVHLAGARFERMLRRLAG